MDYEGADVGEVLHGLVKVPLLDGCDLSLAQRKPLNQHIDHGVHSDRVHSLFCCVGEFETFGE